MRKRALALIAAGVLLCAAACFSAGCQAQESAVLQQGSAAGGAVLPERLQGGGSAGASGSGPAVGAGEGRTADADGLAMSAEDWAAVRRIIADQAARQGASPEDAPAALDEARGANAHVYAWLCVPGTNVSLALLQHPGDDTYYYSHASTGERSVVGAAYTERANSRDFGDPVTVVYGHSFSDADIVFTQLSRFAEPGFFDAHDEFLVFLPGRVLTYRVVSACETNDVHVLGAYDFSDRDLLQGYLDFVADPALPGCRSRGGVSLEAGRDRIVQLSTCTLPQKDGARFVVTGALVGEEET